jgi:NAD(P)-dependent dehydrogenase (short-subunit alcohol dehydrogenase family)
LALRSAHIAMQGEKLGERLVSKRILITGAVDNIGKACVEQFVAEGARVVIADIDIAHGRATAEELGAAFVEVDVADESSVRSMIDQATGELGGLDALCQLAAIQIVGALETLSSELWDRTFAVNTRSQFLGAKYAIPALRASGKGSIVNMSSQAAKLPAGVYGAAKAAVISLTRTLASELAGDNIRANAVCPGWVDTPFNGPIIGLLGGSERHKEIVKQSVPLGRQATPAEMAPLMVFLVSDESSYITGQAISIDGGATMS